MTISRLNSTLHASDYNRTAQRCGVVHLGLGAFHRAHQAVYFDALLRKGEENWMIIGASLRSSKVKKQLSPQNELYTVLVRDGNCDASQSTGEKKQIDICSSISRVIVAPEAPQDLIATLTDPMIALVTLTVTEKGYCIDPATGALKLDDTNVKADLKSLNAPKTAIGFIVAGLSARRNAGITPFTVLSCDNLPNNGKRTRQGVMAMAEIIDPDLAQWIDQNVAFPSSMVDRIVPATTDEDILALTDTTGYQDLAMVKTEPFSQWVIEDNFCNRRPPLENVGVQMTKDVEGWENAKLRLLNGAHSALAYLGNLAGYTYVHQAIQAPGFKSYINKLWDEAQSTLEPVQGFDAEYYRHQLEARFCNSTLQHLTYQIAMDGSQKLPQRLLNSIRTRLANRQSCTALSLGVAAWMRWQLGSSETGEAYTVQDPMASTTAAIVAKNKDNPKATVKGLLALTEIFGGDLANNTTLINQLTTHLTRLLEDGAQTTVSNFGADHG